jgi:hypothetical protein
MNIEIWKTIENYNNYEISTYGNVRNIKTNKNLKAYLDIPGYLNITLYKNKKNKSFKIHRLVAFAFIENIKNKLTVNHIDKNKQNNCILNLEWATMSEQNMAINKNICFNKISKIAVYKINPVTNIIIDKYNSISEASKWIFNEKLTNSRDFNKIVCSSISSKICAVAKGNRNIAYNYKWKYYNEIEQIDNKIEKTDNEIWKEIPLELTNNKNGYFISSCARFKNTKGHIITDYKYSSGYKRLSIQRKTILLHRLVAITFIPNLENKEQVNHIDGNKLNNKLENLEWVTNKENQVHKINSGLYKGEKGIIQYDLNMNKINEFKSIITASKILNIDISIISNNCRGKTKNPKCGYQFRYSK